MPRRQARTPAPPFAAAKLLFQWRVLDAPPRPRKKRVCEERIVVFRSATAKSALARATKYGRDASYTETRDGVRLAFEFVGVLELLGPGEVFFDPSEDVLEVWWEFRERVAPMERRKQLIPPENELRALRPLAPDRRMKIPDATAARRRKG